MEAEFMSPQKLIIFDCDGTLIDSQHLIVEAMQRAFAGIGLACPDRAAVLDTIGLSILESMAVLAPSEPPALLARLAVAYRDRCISLRGQGGSLEPLFPGAAAFIKELARSETFLLGLATGKSRRGVARFLAAEGLEGLFSTTQTADDAPSKPHPAMLLQAMAEAGAEPEHTLMVGDSVFDMEMARRAGVTPVAVAWGYGKASDLRRAGAKHIVRSFAELDALLRAFGGSPSHLAVAE
jgi:phosphoglycolate phosphatase